MRASGAALGDVHGAIRPELEPARIVESARVMRDRGTQVSGGCLRLRAHASQGKCERDCGAAQQGMRVHVYSFGGNMAAKGNQRADQAATVPVLRHLQGGSTSTLCASRFAP